MPSSSEAQARYMAAIAHGWHPDSKHAPSQKVAQDFNQADKGSALLSNAMKHNHAAGGPIPSLAAYTGNPMTMRSSVPHIGQPIAGAGRMRMPHVPLVGMMHNIDQHMAGARTHLPALKAALGGRIQRYDEGGKVQSSSPGSPGVRGAIHDALVALKDYVIDRPAREIAAQRDVNDEAVMSGTYTGPSRPVPQDNYADGGEVNSSSPGSPGVSGAVKDALAALKDYMIDRPKRELAAEREGYENSLINNTYTGPTRQGAPQENYAQGGAVNEQAKSAIRNALAHLANKDASSAAATLHASPHAMQHPVVRLAAHALQTGQELAPATQQLTALP